MLRFSFLCSKWNSTWIRMIFLTSELALISKTGCLVCDFAPHRSQVISSQLYLLAFQFRLLWPTCGAVLSGNSDDLLLVELQREYAELQAQVTDLEHLVTDLNARVGYITPLLALNLSPAAVRNSWKTLDTAVVHAASRPPPKPQLRQFALYDLPHGFTSTSLHFPSILASLFGSEFFSGSVALGRITRSDMSGEHLLVCSSNPFLHLSLGICWICSSCVSTGDPVREL